MKIVSMLAMMSLLVLSIGMVSADTIINGKIYNADFSQTVSGASVMITCNGVIQLTTSGSSGSYGVIYNETGLNSCGDGDSLNVFANHSSYGSNSVSGVIDNDVVMSFDIGIVNVPLVPEFGLIAGMVTILGAIGMFFIVRRN